nr:class I SAM-dependent methyltransferase [Neptunicella marina]
MRPINDTLYLFLNQILNELPDDAHILCVGAGTGNEIINLAALNDSWRFTIVEPSAGMNQVCQANLQMQGILERCRFHQDYLNSFDDTAQFNAATSFLVSHFMTDTTIRREYFSNIAMRLLPKGILVSTDLSADTQAENYPQLLRFWFAVMSGSLSSEQELEKFKQAYRQGLAIIPPVKLAELIETCGFESPLHFYQAGMINGFYACKAA